MLVELEDADENWREVVCRVFGKKPPGVPEGRLATWSAYLFFVTYATKNFLLFFSVKFLGLKISKV